MYCSIVIVFALIWRDSIVVNVTKEHTICYIFPYLNAQKNYTSYYLSRIEIIKARRQIKWEIYLCLITKLQYFDVHQPWFIHSINVSYGMYANRNIKILRINGEIKVLLKITQKSIKSLFHLLFYFGIDKLKSTLNGKAISIFCGARNINCYLKFSD